VNVRFCWLLGRIKHALVLCIYPDFENPNTPLANQFRCDSSHCMIGGGFLDPEARSDLIELTRDGSVAHLLAEPVNRRKDAGRKRHPPITRRSAAGHALDLTIPGYTAIGQLQRRHSGTSRHHLVLTPALRLALTLRMSVYHLDVKQLSTDGGQFGGQHNDPIRRKIQPSHRRASSFHFKRTHTSRTADGILCGLVMVPTGEGE
jgi:hypothetical protein